MDTYAQKYAVLGDQIQLGKYASRTQDQLH